MADPGSSIRILGIDPGLNITGYAVLESQGPCRRPGIVEAGVIRGGSSSSKTLPERLATIHQGVKDVITSLRPTAMALEELYSHYERPRTSILMGHARGVICLAAAEAEIPVVSYAATRVKKLLTGNGRAGKSQMQLAVQRELSLPQLPEPADVADALAIALGHFYLRGRKEENACEE